VVRVDHHDNDAVGALFGYVRDDNGGLGVLGNDSVVLSDELRRAAETWTPSAGVVR
jgi:hypothetical protein